MNIKFKTIQIQNFKSFGQATIINFEDLHGLNYIFGTNLDNPSSRNGAGKSVAFVDAIIFALYGRTIKNTNNQYLRNRYCSEKLKTYVKLYFNVDGIQYTSQCYSKSNIKAVGMTLSKFNNETQQWEDLTQSSIIKTKQYIAETILNCSFELFKSSIIISASDCLNFYQGMSKQQKRNYIENIFNLNCFGIMFNLIKTDLNDLKKQISYNNNEIIKNSSQLEQLKIKFQNYDKKINQNLQLIKNQIINKRNQIIELEKQKVQLSNNLQNIQQISEQNKQLKSNLKKLNNAKNTLEKQIIKSQSKISSINAFIEQIKKIKEGLCEVCTQMVNTKYNYDNKLLEIQSLQNNISNIQQKLNKISLAIQQHQNKIEELQNNINEHNKLQSNITSLLLNIKHLKIDIKNLKDQYDKANNEQINPFEQLIQKTQNDLNLLKKQVQEYHNNVKHLDILKEVCSQNGVKSFIIKDIVKLLNSLIQKYLNEIGADYLVYFDQTFDFKFITVAGECEYSNFSTGQRQRIQIATIFAFRDLILNGKMNSDLFIIDQFLDSGIDAICIKNVLQILYKKVIEQKQNIFIISHRQETTEHHIFNNIIEVIKENGISKIKIN